VAALNFTCANRQLMPSKKKNIKALLNDFTRKVVMQC